MCSYFKVVLGSQKRGFQALNQGLVSCRDENVSDIYQRSRRSRPASPVGDAVPDGEVAQANRVVTEKRGLHTQPYVIPDDANSLGKAWKSAQKVQKEDFVSSKSSKLSRKRHHNDMRQEKALLAEKSLPHPEMEDVKVKLQIKLNLMTLCPEEEQTLCTVFISDDN